MKRNWHEGWRRRAGGAGGLLARVSLALVPAALAAQEIGVIDRSDLARLPEVTNWPLFNGGLDGQRFSELTGINTGNVAGLREVCRLEAGELGVFEPGPVLAEGMLFITSGHGTMAVDPATCGVVWKTSYQPMQRNGVAINRGVAYDSGKVFRGLPDGTVIAYDAHTGQQIWRAVAGDPAKGELLSSSPIVWNGMLFIGLAGGDLGIHGRMFAFDTATGKKLWQFNLVPQAGEPGSETWRDRSYEHGGGGTWSSYALDPATGELFVPVANPAPDLDRSPRSAGPQHTNLYTNSVVVLDARTGRLKWYYQTRPADDHDYGVTSAPMLFSDVDGQGRGRARVALGAKDGHVYVIDRDSHRLVFKQPVVRIANLLKSATPEGTYVCPGTLGGIEWNGVAFDRANKTLVVGAVDWCHRIILAPQEYRPGEVYYGGKMIAGADKANGTITALDSRTGRIRWQVKPGAPVVSGVTPTAGGVVFAGDLAGNFYALRSVDGTVLRKIATGGALAGGIVTYEVSGRQYVALTSGNVSRSTFGVSGTPTLIVYAVGAPGAAPHVAGTTPQLPSPSGMARADPEIGRARFAATCAGCHGARGEGAIGPKLAGIDKRATPAQIAEWIRNPKSAAMPRLVPGAISEADVGHITAYLMHLGATE